MVFDVENGLNKLKLKLNEKEMVKVERYSYHGVVIRKEIRIEKKRDEGKATRGKKQIKGLVETTT